MTGVCCKTTVDGCKAGYQPLQYYWFRAAAKLYYSMHDLRYRLQGIRHSGVWREAESVYPRGNSNELATYLPSMVCYSLQAMLANPMCPRLGQT
eukprot:422510-Pelagomonas_calceolata.AAC.1